MTLLSGSELVLLAEVPRAGDRWHQVHFNRDVAEQFFRLTPGDERLVTLERIGSDGKIAHRTSRPLVYSEANANSKIEFELGTPNYPDDGVPLLLLLEIEVRHVRFVLLLPGQTGFSEMEALNRSGTKVGRGLHRSITTLDEVLLRWPGCPLGKTP